MEYLTSDRVRLDYDLPLAEIVLDFFDLLKTKSRGYASLDYELKDYEPGDLVRLDIRIAGEIVDALSLIVHADRAYAVGRGLAERCARRSRGRCSRSPSRRRWAAASSRARAWRRCARTCWPSATVATSRRKRKLLEKQKAGKKRMKMVGTVEIPQEAFLAVLDLGEGKEGKK